MGFRIDDPWERELPYGQLLAVFDPTQGRLVTLEGSMDEQKAHAKWRAQREADWMRLYPDPHSRLVVSTAESRLDALVKFFHARMRLHR